MNCWALHREKRQRVVDMESYSSLVPGPVNDGVTQGTIMIGPLRCCFILCLMTLRLLVPENLL